MNFEELTFSDITQITVQQSVITIQFTLKGIRYLLSVHPDEQDFYCPRMVAHLNEHQEFRTSCQFGCEYCHELNEHKQALFRHLLTFPSIRLHWLFLSHREAKT